MFQELYDNRMPDSQVQFWCNKQFCEFHAIGIIKTLEVFFCYVKTIQLSKKNCEHRLKWI